MKVNTLDLEIFKDLLEFNVEEIYYDLHNDFDCLNLNFENDTLVLTLKGINSSMLYVKFRNVELTLFNFSENSNISTIDSLYRGKFEIDNKLVESKDKLGYIYLEFYDGVKLEFWAESIEIQ